MCIWKKISRKKIYIHQYFQNLNICIIIIFVLHNKVNYHSLGLFGKEKPQTSVYYTYIRINKYIKILNILDNKHP